jgi:hypothetical protein
MLTIKYTIILWHDKIWINVCWRLTLVWNWSRVVNGFHAHNCSNGWGEHWVVDQNFQHDDLEVFLLGFFAKISSSCSKIIDMWISSYSSPINKTRHNFLSIFRFHVCQLDSNGKNIKSSLDGCSVEHLCRPRVLCQNKKAKYIKGHNSIKCDPIWLKSSPENRSAIRIWWRVTKTCFYPQPYEPIRWSPTKSLKYMLNVVLYIL